MSGATVWKRGVIAIILVACVAMLARAQSSLSDRADRADPWTVASDTTVRQLLAERVGPNGVGAVVGVIEPAGTRILTYGRSGAADSRPLDGNTVFQIGSLTKVFTGLLLADMVVRGEVGLEDPVARYLPDGVRMPQRGRPITLLDLSKHWSALPSMPTNFALDGQPEPYVGTPRRNCTNSCRPTSFRENPDSSRIRTSAWRCLDACWRGTPARNTNRS